MFVVEIGSLLTTALWVQALAGHGEAPAWFIGAVSLWLWFTVLFANFAEAIAEGRGKAQAEALRRMRRGHHRQAAAAAGVEAPSSAWCPPPSCARGTCTWWKPATSSRPTAK